MTRGAVVPGHSVIPGLTREPCFFHRRGHGLRIPGSRPGQAQSAMTKENSKCSGAAEQLPELRQNCLQRNQDGHKLLFIK